MLFCFSNVKGVTVYDHSECCILLIGFQYFSALHLLIETGQSCDAKSYPKYQFEVNLRIRDDKERIQVLVYSIR